GCMNRIVTNCQPRGVLRFRVYPQQELIGQLIAGGCGGLAKSQVQNISVRVVGNANRVHRRSLSSLTNLVCSQDEVVLYSSSIKAKAHYDNYAGVSMRKVWIGV